MTHGAETDLLPVIGKLTQLYQSLVSVLENEREALRQRRPEALASTTDEKRLVLAEIEQIHDRLPLPLADLVANSDVATRAEVEPVHTNLMNLAREARDFNAVNGKIISRSQQSVRELMSVLNGHENHALYGAHGTPNLGQAASAGPTIANA